MLVKMPPDNDPLTLYTYIHFTVYFWSTWDIFDTAKAANVTTAQIVYVIKV